MDEGVLVHVYAWRVGAGFGSMTWFRVRPPFQSLIPLFGTSIVGPCTVTVVRTCCKINQSTILELDCAYLFLAHLFVVHSYYYVVST